ncbi:unnamed protein product [Rotaria magnacalcarata]|uniref:F-box domain-containing protein n=4 Tax=Rotaria magnacalcarata TaxID=392030 RepID=A0A815JJZ6_9BILA|nr:unnamed protein product [Rotaria magnacalcarata]CAF4236539.1 unnamed protein product [Rotaria magnacalcarata]
MECQDIKLSDLPDELLLIIFKKLKNVEILYSLMDISKQLNQIVSDPIFTREITLMKQITPIKDTSSLPDFVLDRFCLEILPKIHDKIQWLKLETLSMERILLAVNNYSNLRQLDIFIMNTETDMQLFTNTSYLVHIFQNQIVTLNINGEEDLLEDHLEINRQAEIFMNILIMCNKLRHFKFYTSVPIGTAYISFGIESPMFLSPTLVELHIVVYRFDECLFLLDGRFNQLRILFVKTFHILSLKRSIINKERLPNLKHVSLACKSLICAYDDVVVPHLQRMINLEKLTLYFVAAYDNLFIDGNNLQKNIISHMPRLKQFIFNIRSMINYDNLNYFPSNEDIHHTLMNFKDNQVTSCVDYFPKLEYGQCRIYSCPYTLTYYENLTNNFPGGLFNTVQQIELFDERPFEHEFFIKISQSFPFLKELTIINSEQQKFNNENRKYSIVNYYHLTKLYLLDVHDDYAEQFLLDTKAYLSEMCTAPKIWRGGGGKTGGSLKIAADAVTAVSVF